MWKSSLELDKFQYMRTNPYIVRLVGLLGVGATVSMAYGLWKYVNIDILYLIIFGPIIIIFVVNKFFRFFLQLFYPKYSIKKHQDFVRKYWSENREPSVNIFLPWAGEDLRLHEEVVKACANIRYSNYKVYMLDDVGSWEHEALARKYGFHYLSRPNKGQYKKSGNLEYGYQHSDGDYIFILDADFIPTKDSLYDLIPYIDSDPQIGILQTPQYFEQTSDVHKRSKIEFGGGNIVEDFYRIFMPCRDEFKASMCVGTSAIYRRDTIEKLDGTPKVHASEDLATGLLITQHGYHVKYLPLIVSMGKSPDTFQGYFKQHMRWCSGNLVFAEYWPMANLNLVARLIYISNPLYYLSEALTVLFSFQFLFLLHFHAETLSIVNTIYFIPYILLSRIIIPLSKKNKNKVGTKLAALSNSYTYFYTYIHMILHGRPSWHPTGVKIKKLHNDFINAINLGFVISSFFILFFLYTIITKPYIFGDYHTYMVIGWTFYSVFWHGLYLHLVLKYIYPYRKQDLSSRYAQALLYVKTHSILILTVFLFGSSFYYLTASLVTPTAPTNTALQSFVNNINAYDRVEVLPIPATSFVLANQSHQSPVSTEETGDASEFSFFAQKGDSVTSLAKKAINAHSVKHQSILNRRQFEYAAVYIVQNSDISKNVKIGEKVEFKKEVVEEAIANARMNRILVSD